MRIGLKKSIEKHSFLSYVLFVQKQSVLMFILTMAQKLHKN